MRRSAFRAWTGGLALAVAVMTATSILGQAVAAHPRRTARIVGAEARPHSASRKAQPIPLAVVSAIAIEPGHKGEIRVKVTATRLVPYHYFRLSDPARLVVDFDGAREGVSRQVFPAHSKLLKRVRVGQWKAGEPSIVRVVADLRGQPAFEVTRWPSGVRITLAGEKLRRASSLEKYLPEQSQKATGPRMGRVPQRIFKSPGRSFRPRFEPSRVAESAPPRMSSYLRRLATKPARVRLPPARTAGERAQAVIPIEPVPDHAPSDLSQLYLARRASHPIPLATVSKIAIRTHRNGNTRVDVATTRRIPYHYFQLESPPRLVVDLRDAQRGWLRYAYPVDSPVLREVRVGQWKSPAPAIVRVVADLTGWPAFRVRSHTPGVRIDLTPREFIPRPIRNPFAYFNPTVGVQRYRALAQRMPPAVGAVPSVAAPFTPPTNLSYLGYVLMEGSHVEAIMADRLHVRFVRQGSILEGRYQVVMITSRAVEIEDLKRNQLFWIKINPSQ